MFDGLLERERVSKHRDVRYQIRNISNCVIDMKDICLSVPLLENKSMIFLDVITSSNPFRFGQKTSFDDVRFWTNYKRGKARQKTSILHPKLKPYLILR